MCEQGGTDMVSIAESRVWEGIEADEPRVFRTLRVVPLMGRSSSEPVVAAEYWGKSGRIRMRATSSAHSRWSALRIEGAP